MTLSTRRRLAGLAVALAALIAGCNPAANGSDPVALRAELGGGNSVFDAYSSSSGSAWADGWTSALDFSGVAWDHPQTATLITPQHVLMADHYSRSEYGLDEITFTAEDGSPVVRSIVSTTHDLGITVGLDLEIGVLDQPVPAGVAHYSVLEPGSEWSYAPDLNGRIAIGTDGERHAFLRQIMDPGGVSCWGVHHVATAAPVDPAWTEEIVPGDSGNPLFLMLNGELILLGANFTPNSVSWVSVDGTSCGDHFGGINSAIDSLATATGLGAGLELSTATLD